MGHLFMFANEVLKQPRYETNARLEYRASENYQKQKLAISVAMKFENRHCKLLLYL